MMIDLTGKSVFVKTQEEYLSILKIARFQGFTWARENHLNHIEIPFPNILNFTVPRPLLTEMMKKHCVKHPKLSKMKKKSRVQ